MWGNCRVQTYPCNSLGWFIVSTKHCLQDGICLCKVRREFIFSSKIFQFWVGSLIFEWDFYCAAPWYLCWAKSPWIQALSKFGSSTLDSCLKVPYFGKAPALGLGLGLYQNSRAPLALTSGSLILVKSCSWGFTLVVMPSSEGLTCCGKKRGQWMRQNKTYRTSGWLR